jgi:hypothetical protein
MRRRTRWRRRGRARPNDCSTVRRRGWDSKPSRPLTRPAVFKTELKLTICKAFVPSSPVSSPVTRRSMHPGSTIVRPAAYKTSGMGAPVEFQATKRRRGPGAARVRGRSRSSVGEMSPRRCCQRGNAARGRQATRARGSRGAQIDVECAGLSEQWRRRTLHRPRRTRRLAGDRDSAAAQRLVRRAELPPKLGKTGRYVSGDGRWPVSGRDFEATALDSKSENGAHSHRRPRGV